MTKKVAIDDENLESATLNGETVSDVITLKGDKDAKYVIRAVDRAGNVTEYTVNMKPISSITAAVSSTTVSNVKSSDAETISAVERQILDISEAFDDGESTEDEWNKLLEAAAKCKDMNKRIADVAEEIIRLTDSVNGYNICKITSEDKVDNERLIEDIDVLLGGDNLTDAEREALEALRETVRALLGRIEAARAAAENDRIKAVDGITNDNVKLDDKEPLEAAKKSLQGVLSDFGDNYTEKEKSDIETKLKNAKEALVAIENAEKAADEINRLPSVDYVKLSDRDEVERIKKNIGSLTDNERAMLGEEAIGKVDALEKRINELTKNADRGDVPKTEDTFNIVLWVAMLLIVGCVLTGMSILKKRKSIL